MQKRTLGQTGEMLSILGFGSIIVMNKTTKEAAEYVAHAVDHGINYFDVAPTYGNAEEMLGPALQPYRANVFLACKTRQRQAVEAEQELHESLRLLQTDYVDLYQHHAVNTMKEAEMLFQPGGAYETLVKAKEQGLARYLGFTTHFEDIALYIISQADFDTVLFPFNWVCWNHYAWGKKLVEKAQETGLGLLAIKALAKRPLAEGEERVTPRLWYYPVDTRQEAADALRFTLSLPVTSALSPGEFDYLLWALETARDFRPLSPQEQAAVAERGKGIPLMFK